MSRYPWRDVETAQYHLEFARRYVTEGSLDDPLVRDAFAMRLMASLEAVLRLDDDTLESTFGDDLREMRGMRNLIAHVYRDTDPNRLLQTAARDLGTYEARLAELAIQFPEPEI